MLSNRFFRITNMKSILPGAYKEDGPIAGGTFWAHTDRTPHWISYYLLWRQNIRVNYKTVDQAFDDNEVHYRITTKEHPYSDWKGGHWFKLDKKEFVNVISKTPEDQLVNIEFYLIPKK